MGLFHAASVSARNYIRLVTGGKLTMPRGRIGKKFRIKDGKYQIFRETECSAANGKPVILVIGFRLRFIRSIPFLHWLFQRICILTTPFWSGLPGFGTKLWMVDPKTRDYLGIYDWKGRKEAKAYINFLIPILKFFSVNGSVWSGIVYGTGLQEFLDKQERSDA